MGHGSVAEHFSSKWVLPAEVRNEFSNIDAASAASASGFLLLRRRGARRELENLRVDSGCGPDLLPTRILKACASELSLPFVKLARRIVATGTWPSCWLLHWVYARCTRGRIGLNRIITEAFSSQHRCPKPWNASWASCFLRLCTRPSRSARVISNVRPVVGPGMHC